MKLFILTFTTIIYIAFTGCERVEGYGDTIGMDIEAGYFNGIEHNLTGKLYYTQADSNSIYIEAQENIIEILKFEIKNDILSIGVEKGISLGNHDPIKLFITSPDIRLLKCNGSGNLFSDYPLVTDNLTIEINGSGNIEAAYLNISKLQSEINGSGNISVGGNSDEHKISIAGSGNLKAFNLETDSTIIDIDGSGNSNVWVNKYLNVNISGSGSVLYLGYPELHTNTQGSGRVISNN